MFSQKLFDIPVVFCTFNRLDCAKRVFERIRQVKPAKLYLVSDGAREGLVGEKERVNAVRQYIESHIDWECNVYKNYAERNMGCGRRMSSGISWAFEKEEKLIILEDDCLADISFFRYCKELLDLYENNNDIMVISGHNELGKLKERESIIFTTLVDVWGWATWKRVWKQYNYDIPEWKRREIIPCMKKFMDDRAVKYYSNAFDAVYTHKLDTWDYQLVHLVFQKEALTIVPSVNMVENIGFGVDATHTKTAPDMLCNESYSIPKVE